MRTTSGRSSRAAATPAAPSPGLADDLEVARRLQHRAQAEPDELLVVDQQHPDASCRQHRLDARSRRPAAGSARQPAAEGAHPLTQPHQPEAAAGSSPPARVRRPVHDPDDQLAGRPLDRHADRARRARACRRWSAPPARSGTRRGRRRGRPGRAVRPAGQRRRSMPASRDSSTSARQVVEARLRGRAARPRRLAAAQDADHLPQLVERLPAGGLHLAGELLDRGRGSAAAISMAPACSTMRLTRWPTASCISRAMRVRSVRTASRASSSRSASARSARSVQRGQQLGAGAHADAERAGQHDDQGGAAEPRLTARPASSSVPRLGDGDRSRRRAAAIRTGQRPS